MAIKTVSLRIRIKTSEGKRVMVRPVYTKKGSLKPLYALVNGVEELHPEGTYALRIGNSWEFVGQATDVVLATKKRREDELANKAEAPTPVAVINESGPEILDALEKYLAEVSVPDEEAGTEALASKTISGIRGIVEAFQRTCKKTLMREVTAADLTGYFSMMRTQANLDPADPEYREKRRKRNVTVKNHWGTLRTFFSRATRIDLKAMLEYKQIPRCKGRVPTAYTPEQMDKMWKVADAEEKIRLQFFCVSGCRRGEVAHLTWDDVHFDTGIADIRGKGTWDTKTRKAREIRLAQR